MGRILQRGRIFMCADCEAETNDRPDTICACGISQARTDLKGIFRCGPNPSPSDTNPARIVVLLDGKVVDPDPAPPPA